MKSLEVTLKFNGKCKECGALLKKGSTAWWYPKIKKMVCKKCSGHKARAMAQRKFAIANTWGGMTS